MNPVPASDDQNVSEPARPTLRVCAGGLLFFGGGGTATIAGVWGLARPAVVAGSVAGVVLTVALAALVAHRWGESPEVRERRWARPPSRRWWLAVPVVGALLGWTLFHVLRATGVAPFIYTMLVVLCVGATVIATVIALSGRDASKLGAGTHRVRRPPG